jgi:biopolymer transport protein TolQ
MASSFWGLISDAVMSSSWLEQGVLLFLLGLSILSWAVIIMKVSALRQARANNERFRAVFAEAAHTGEVSEGTDDIAGPAPLHAIFTAALAAREEAKNDAQAPVEVPAGELALRSPRQLEERVRLAMDHALKGEFMRIGKHMSVLATAGSASPFIGLFGTVWGILVTFQTLGAAKSASLQVLGPPIAAALIATAAGLAVAIPAVMFYNWLTASIDEDQEEAQAFGEDLLRLLRATGAVAEPGASRPPVSSAITKPSAPGAPARESEPARAGTARTVARSA